MFRALVFALTLVTGFPAFAAAGIKPGDVAPDFALNGADGKVYKLSQFKGKTVVLEWFNPDCPYVHKFYDTSAMQNMQRKMTGEGVIWLTVASSAEGKQGFLTAATGSKIRAEKKMASTALLLDGQGVAAREYGAKTTPHMFVIDPSGKLVYEGAMDDRASTAKDSLKGATNYVEAAVAALRAHQPVKTASTVPYGCSVKY